MMKPHLLYIGMQYDYGHKERGLSFEHRNFHQSLSTFCAGREWKFSHFDFMQRGKEVGRAQMTEELLSFAVAQGCSMVFAALFDVDYDPFYEVFRELSGRGVPCVHWFSDDHWRFDGYSSKVAPNFDVICTTAASALPKYEQAGLKNRVIKTQWACNHELYCPAHVPTDIEASFIGLPHGNRKQILDWFQANGLPVQVYGFGWTGRPRLPFHQMTRVFSRSKINLNLSKSSILGSEQIKGRNFEIPACGGFQLSTDAENLSAYFSPGREIVIAQSYEEMLEQARFYLTHETERARIARSGYERALAEHTWHHRFTEIFARVKGFGGGQALSLGAQYLTDALPALAASQSAYLKQVEQRNRELIEAKQAFLQRIEVLEAENSRATALYVEREEAIQEFAAATKEAQARASEVQATSRKIQAEIQTRITECESLAEGMRLQKSEYERIQLELQNTLQQRNQYIATLEQTIRGITRLKLFRLREALQTRPITARSLTRAGYLLAGILTPRVIREFFRPLTLKVKYLVNPLSRPAELPVPEVIKRTSQKRWDRNKPLLSVIMPCFNYGRFLTQALDSVLAQTFQNFEVLIVDCSTDEDTKTLLRSLNHPKVRVFFREGRHLLGDNRNFGIARARGKYVLSFDPDDILKPTYFEKALYLLESGNFDVCSTSLQVFGEGSEQWLLHPRPQMRELLQWNLISVVGIYSRSVWKRAGRFYDYGMGRDHVHEDWDFWVRAMGVGARVVNIRQPLMLYRLHGTNMSKGKEVPSLEVQRSKLHVRNRKYIGERQIRRSEQRNRERYLVENAVINLLPEDGKEKTLDLRHVAFAIPYTVLGGGHKRFLELAQFLTEHGYSVSVLTTVPTDPALVDTSTEYETFTKDIFPLPEFLGNELEWRPFIHYFIRSRGIGTIILGGSGFFYEMLPELKQSFPALRILDQQFNTEGHFVSNRRFRDYIDHTIAENESVAARLAQEFDEPNSKASLIHNGVDVHGRFAPSSEPATLPESIPAGARVIAYIGRVSREKGPDIFLEIAAQLSDDPSLHFVMAGPGYQLDEMKDLAAKLGIADRVVFPGIVDSRAYLAATDVLVVPSRIDGRPNVILEAMSMGVAIVASAVGGIPSLIKDRETGMLCRPDDVPGYVAAVRRLLDSPSLFSDVRAAARRYAVEHLEARKMLEQYLPLLSGELTAVQSTAGGV